MVSKATSRLLLDLRHRPARRIKGKRGWLFHDYNYKIYYNYRVSSLYTTKEYIVNNQFKENKVIFKRKVI